MKYLFAVIAVLLLLASAFVWASMPGVRTDRRVIMYWTTDANPARIEQVRVFDQFQRRIGLVEEDGTPMIGLELDTGNNENDKKVIQSVSGVAADTMDQFGGNNIRLFDAMGVLVDVSPWADKLNFNVETTYPGVVEEISVTDFDGTRRQLAYPCNVALTLLMPNKAMFRELGMPVPEGRWTFEEFEETGVEFVKRANEASDRLGRTFFVDSLDLLELRRSMGVDRFNETLTDVNFEHPDYVRGLELLRRWTYDLRLIPSNADRDSFATAAGYGGAGPAIFEQGYYGMFKGGRWNLIGFRQTNADRVERGEPILELGSVEPPHGGHPNVLVGTRAATVYIDGSVIEEPIPLKDEFEGVVLEPGTPWAVVFLAFLSSPEYGNLIIADADGLPGNPELTGSDAFLRPTENPEMGIYAQTEYAIHGTHLEAAKNIADPRSYSPFVLVADLERDKNQQEQRYLLANPEVDSAQEAMEEAARRVRARIAVNLETQPELREEYERRLADQAEIDRLKAAGEKIPAYLIRNAFYLRYYREQGMLAED
jgi:multiple sugar transport system substrate-binding protein